MESSQFINQTRLSKKQLQQFHVQQQQNQQKFFLDSPANDNYQPSRCQYFNSVTTPTSAHHYPPSGLSNGHHQTMPSQHHPPGNHCAFEQASPSHRHTNIKKFHQSDPNSIEVCIEYENQHNSHHVGVDPSSVSDDFSFSPSSYRPQRTQTRELFSRVSMV
jgi:hypothetical protein